MRIALWKDDSKPQPYRGPQHKPSIELYSTAGRLIRKIPVRARKQESLSNCTNTLQWDKGSIKGLGWSEDEKMLVVTQDGTVRCYYDLQGDFTQFSLGNVDRH